MAFRILSLLLCLLVAGPMSTSAHAVARPETRVGNFFPASPKSAADFAAQPVDPRQENPACGYDFASGVHKYLYAGDDPVNNVDPSGHFFSAIEFGISSSIAIGVRGSWEGARAPTYAGAITAALTVALIITAADVIPDAIEKIKQRRRENKVPYVRYDIRPGMTYFGPGTWVLGAEGANLEWSAAIAVTYFYGVDTLYMYTIMARPGDVTPYGLVNGLPQYRLARTISAPDVILTRIVKKPDDGYQGPF